MRNAANGNSWTSTFYQIRNRNNVLNPTNKHGDSHLFVYVLFLQEVTVSVAESVLQILSRRQGEAMDPAEPSVHLFRAHTKPTYSMEIWRNDCWLVNQQTIPTFSGFVHAMPSALFRHGIETLQLHTLTFFCVYTSGRHCFSFDTHNWGFGSVCNAWVLLHM